LRCGADPSGGGAVDLDWPAEPVPVPLLDGGHLLFYTVEAVRGRPLSERAQEMGFRIGLGLVLMLMVFATYNDILHLAHREPGFFVALPMGNVLE